MVKGANFIQSKQQNGNLKLNTLNPGNRILYLLMMNKLYIVLFSITFLMIGLIEGGLYVFLYNYNHRLIFFAVLQWPFITAIYTSFIFGIMAGNVRFANAMYFIGYFTAIASLLAICFYAGSYGFFAGIIVSGFSSLLFFGGIK
ncbi:MAG TPA: hypothetical protein VF623_14805, partial [Segetibacter sp.]